MTLTKAAGGLIGALLVFLLGKWAAETLYHVESRGEAAYVIETDEEEGGGDEEEEVSFAQLMADADPDSGARVFKKCAACHKLEKGDNSTGPYLYGVVGREVASADGFGYSDAMQAHGGEWTPEELSEFLTKPSAAVPGTSMSFAGLSKVGDRVDVIAYLNDHSDEPYDIAAAADDGAADDGAEEAPAEDEVAAEEDSAQVAAEEEEMAEEAPAEDAASEAAEDEAAATGENATEEAPAEDAAPEDEPAATEEDATEEAPAEDAASDDEAAAGDPDVDAQASAEEATETDQADEAASADAAPAGGSALLADADVEKGEKVFKKCAACHKLEEGQNVVGPYLYGVVGRPVASAEGFNYTDAMKEYGGDWTPERLDAYLAKPRDVVPGTSMSFAGLRKEEERINVIGYLDSLDN